MWIRDIVGGDVGCGEGDGVGNEVGCGVGCGVGVGVGVGLITGEVLPQTFFLPCFTYLKVFFLSFFSTPTLLLLVPALLLSLLTILRCPLFSPCISCSSSSH